MAAPSSYPSWAYNNLGQPAVIVTTLLAFNALPAPGTWSATPFTVPTQPPFDPGLPVTDARAQQELIEARITNLLLSQMAGIPDDVVTVMRADVLANDSSVTT